MKKKFYFFLILTHFTFGLIYIVLIPPFQSPDEQNHYLRTKIIYNDSVVIQKYDNRLGSFFYKHHLSFTRFTGEIAFNGLLLNSAPWILFGNLPKDYRLDFIDIPNTALYSAILYFPQSFSNLFDDFLSVYNSYILGKLFALSFFCLSLFYITKSLRFKYSYTIYIYALLPVNLMISASYNADTLNNLATICVFSIFLKDYSRNKFIDILVLTIAIVIISCGKLSSLPVIILIYLYLYKSFSKKIFLFLSILITIISISGILVTYSHLQELYIPYQDYNRNYLSGQPLILGVQPKLQILFLLKDPAYFMNIIFESIENDYEFIFKSSIGQMGWLEWEINKFSMKLYSIPIIFFSFYGRYFKNRIVNKFHFMNFGYMLALALVLIFTFMAIMYITWTPVGFVKVNNLQGRYFYAGFLMFFLSFTYFRFLIIPKNYLIFFIGIILLSQFLTIYQIYYRYYSI